MTAPQSPASGLDTIDALFDSPKPRAKADDERRYRIVRDVADAFDLSINCMQIARWLHPFDEIARHAFFRDLRRSRMKAAGLPLEILGRFA